MELPWADQMGLVLVLVCQRVTHSAPVPSIQTRNRSGLVLVSQTKS